MIIRGLLILGSLALSTAAAAQAIALGLTRSQLEDAELVDSRGNEIGDVEYAITKNGRTVALAVEVDRRDPQPDKLVAMPLSNLRAVPERGDPGDFQIVTTMSAAQVSALPAVSRRR